MEKERLKNNELVMSPAHSKLLPNIETAVRFGSSVLLQDVGETLDPSLATVIDKALIRKDNADWIKVGDQLVRYHDKFRFFMSTKLNNPQYSPEMSTKVTIVNFAVKEEGLKEQLLGLVVRQENSDLEVQKDRLVVGMAEKRRKQVEMEDRILSLLSSVGAGKSILEDEALVNTLQDSKTTADGIKVDLVTMEENNKKIEAARAEYRPSAHRAAILFFILVDLARVDPMYQYSLEAYLRRFRWSLGRLAAEKKTTDVAARVQLLNNIHTEAIYRYVYRGLFAKHKLLFTFQMCMKILLTEDPPRFSPVEYQFFLRGGTVMDRDLQPKSPCTDWLSEPLWDNITELDKMESFRGIVGSFESSAKEWRKWFRTAEPERAPLPGEWESKCNPLQRMIIVRCLRPDRVVQAATDFIRLNMGPVFVSPVATHLGELADEAGPTSPLIFILSPGVDPTIQLRDLADQRAKTLDVVALGRGQWAKARPKLLEAAKVGNWIFLANCHLDLRNMAALEKILEDMASIGSQAKPHRDFRLWLSSTPQPNFPISILQAATKITTEPPRGIRANLQRIYEAKLKEPVPALVEPVNTRYRRLVFSLAFFHSVLLERRKFLSLGFNIPYDFNDGDLDVCQLLLHKYLVASPQQVPWDAIKYLIAEANYGSQPLDLRWDRRLVNVYVKSFFNETVLSQDHYPLSALPTYFIPDDGPRQGYLTYINSLPTEDLERPELFGQHPNAEIASQVQYTGVLLDTIIDLQPRLGAAAGAAGAGASLTQMASDLLERIPEQIGQSSAPGEITEDDPLNTVLQHETERYMKILGAVRRSLGDLIKALAGQVVMSGELEEVAAALTGGRVPALWLKGYPSLKPLSTWTRDLQLRVEQLAKWRDAGLPPKTFWLSGFTFPTGFLTALKQVAAQAQDVSIDKLVWQFEATTAISDQEVAAAPAEGALIRGMYLEGAGWNLDGRQLVEPDPMQLVCPMPIVHFKAVPAEAKKRREKAGGPKLLYQCPTYYYPVRTGERERPSYMLTVELDSGATDPDHWIKRGTALLLSLAQ
ncbi:putative Dynein-1-beta heavy chain; flagellar inner arm I1 complex [Paratrimastix pyriformis]|uniref:Dynein-1-beta heavy chain n=1 Tax=Paratrimastix pyriformis TaxID=342808 RepID=A0ABQ8UCW4_9EUKA|nr:putative Dynein-1-beta heavy chain; flagellar inner arm I1 complex [Paratrimastix pyriformis]